MSIEPFPPLLEQATQGGHRLFRVIDRAYPAVLPFTFVRGTPYVRFKGEERYKIQARFSDLLERGYLEEQEFVPTEELPKAESSFTPLRDIAHQLGEIRIAIQGLRSGPLGGPGVG